MTLDFIYPDAPIGAECRGVNLAEIGHEEFTALSQLFAARSVLCIRDQNLSEGAYINFAKRFGAVEQLYMSDYAHPEYPEILIVSNINWIVFRSIIKGKNSMATKFIPNVVGYTKRKTSICKVTSIDTYFKQNIF